MDWSRNWPVDFNAGKIQFDSLHPSHNTGAIDVKMHGFVFEKKPSLKMLGLAFSSRLDWGSKTASKKIGALIRSMRFLSPEVALYPHKSTTSLAWDTDPMSGLVLLATTLTCYINYRNGYVGLLVLHLLPLLHPCLIVEI